MKARVLIVEDDPKIRAELLLLLRDAGHTPAAVETAEAALAAFEPAANPPPDLLLLDIRLGGMSGVELVQRLTTAGRLPATVVISGEASISETVHSLQLGVYDFIEKPFSDQRLLQSVQNALRHVKITGQLASLQAELAGRTPLLGASDAMVDLRKKIERAARSESRVLILGESGTGKELVADGLHHGSGRSDEPFVKINCAALPAHLVEDELFGHLRGAFTDAHRDRPGLFEEADGGTLLLDEIGDMDMRLQGRLLRVLEDGRIRRVGDTRERAVDVRIIASTNRNLESAVAESSFRQDLYFRLAHLLIQVPPLRNRSADIQLLFRHFVDEACRRNRRRPLHVDSSVYPVLETYRWPGNVRELKNLCERMVVFGSDPLDAGQLPSAFFQDGPSCETGLLPSEGFPTMPLRRFKRQVEKEYIEGILQRSRWNVTAAAAVLEIQRTHLHQKMTALGISRPGSGPPSSDR